MGNIQKKILKDKQIIKFCLYGFLKNLRFFEPYLLIYLLSNDITLLQIGILMSLKELAINLLEVPSGILADLAGRKNSLKLSFVFYILSFILFYLCDNFSSAALAMALYGVGDAFRSGTHKAMIYSYLDLKGWETEKTFVYGRTRSYSLIGTTVSSIISIIIVLNVNQINNIFLFAVIPYILDFILISTYPESINFDESEKKMNLWELLGVLKMDLTKNKNLRKIIINEGIFESVIKVIKDFIQPIMESIFITGGLILLVEYSAEDNLMIVLGVIYAAINIVSAYASRYSYLFDNRFESKVIVNGLYLLLGFIFLLLGIFTENPGLVFLLYFMINIIMNIRKPVYVSVIDDNMQKKERASVLSVVSLTTSLLVVILAPLAGYIADEFGISFMMLLLSFLVLISSRFVKINGKT